MLDPNATLNNFAAQDSIISDLRVENARLRKTLAAILEEVSKKRKNRGWAGLKVWEEKIMYVCAKELDCVDKHFPFKEAGIIRNQYLLESLARFEDWRVKHII